MKRPSYDLHALFSPVMAITNAGLASIRQHFELVTSGALPAQAARARSNPQGAAGTAALIAIVGPLAQRANFLTDFMSWPSYDAISAQLQTALADKSVDQIVMFVDSPGGDASGCGELADEILAARNVKPITAFVSGCACSAAYWLASSATRIVAQPSAELGSIGVILTHFDYSQALAQEGIRPTIIRSVPRKADAGPYEPLSPAALADAQAMIADFHGMFVAGVAKGRKVPVSTVNRDYGQGSTMLAADAQRAGMIDAVAPSLAAALARPKPAGGKANAAALAHAERMLQLLA